MVNQPEVLANYGESVESFKRKHIRQNRDIIKANTFQSLRIQNLEKEVRRLSMENIELRTANIHLQAQFDKGDSVNYVRMELEKKLRECGDILSLLNQESHTLDDYDIPAGEILTAKKSIPPAVDEPFVDFGAKLERRRADLPSISESSGMRTSMRHSAEANSEIISSPPHQGETIIERRHNRKQSSSSPPADDNFSLVELEEVPDTQPSHNRRETRDFASSDIREETFVNQGKRRDNVRPNATQSLRQPPLRVNPNSILLEEQDAEKENLVLSTVKIKVEEESPKKSILTPNQSSNKRLEDQLQEDGVSSRRARKQVNYALPSLRTKMRREETPGEHTVPRRIKKEDHERKVVRRTSKERDLAGIAATTPSSIVSATPESINRPSEPDVENPRKENNIRRRRTSSLHSPIDSTKDSNIFEFEESDEGGQMGRKRRISMVA
ncbi:Shugoshin [Neolecta irregularis DAH-3]|uniref:Shugoshin n=1 Tax=Neolecta irregularis (strain DAH-3) TaxID=1198029 RepID=A0A1U7LIE8_NEOID|nr:Shugoshin [Neolecta irregularis DAH-3]|eukprot:OLL22427.1 Shugoshin [Neolecta irregularis DAH-3]